MKERWDEIFDNLKEEDILRNLPENLPEMEEELAAKRIENRVMQEMQKETKKQKKWNRKRVAAVICGVAVLGALGHQPILAGFQKVFHDLPGVGVYINEKDEKIYAVQIDSPVQEKDGVHVELLDFYCEGKQIYGTVRITGENLLDMSGDYTNQERDALLDETFQTTWYYGEESKPFFSSGRRLEMDDEDRLVRYDQKGSEWLYLEDKGIDTYYLEVEGFERFTLKIVEPKTVENPEKLGYSQTLNDTTITARAAVVGNQIELEYYILPSDEVKLAFENQRKYFTAQMPYQFNLENQPYVENAKGERLEAVEWKTLRSGYKFWYEGGEEDFPLTFHRPTLTGTNTESVTMELTLPKDGESITENLPKIAFQYGTVEMLSLRKEIGTYQDGNTENPKESPAAIVDVTYRVVPKEGLRQMYAVNLNVAGAYESERLDIGGDSFVSGVRCCLKDTEQKTMQMTLDKPSFWIVGDYEIVIEKPIS